MGKNYHVVPQNGQWAVKKENSQRASKILESQKGAIQFAKEQAKKCGSELLIHGKNGLIRERNSYGDDPYPPKG